MPGGDRTGPMGIGPMTGRGAGYGAGYETPGYRNFMPGYCDWGGGGRGMGRGRGWRHRYWATGLPGWARHGAAPGWIWHDGPDAWDFASKDEELSLLKRQAKAMEHPIENIRKRINELEAVAES